MDDTSKTMTMELWNPRKMGWESAFVYISYVKVINTRVHAPKNTPAMLARGTYVAHFETIIFIKNEEKNKTLFLISNNIYFS